MSAAPRPAPAGNQNRRACKMQVKCRCAFDHAAPIAAFTAHDGPLKPHPVYGDCTKEEFARLHAMHVADHLSALDA